MPFLTFPLALLALAGVPALVAIYWLRNRFRRYPVSSLMLWSDQQQARQGGLRVKRIQTPLLFFLELVALLLLVWAATGPVMRAGRARLPLVVVLDDSYSMTARTGATGGGSVRDVRGEAIEAIVAELGRDRYAARFILAGTRPQVLADASTTPAEARAALARWRCKAPTADLAGGVALAAELAGAQGKLLVVTDHAPEREPEAGKLRWWSFGGPRPNLALVNAARTRREAGEVCLLEVANLAATPQRATLTLLPEPVPPAAEGGVPATPAADAQRWALDLGAGETRRVFARLPADAPPMVAALEPDALDLDNRVVLLPEPLKALRVQLGVRDARMQPLVRRALESVPGVVFVNDASAAPPPDLVVSDGGARPEAASSWALNLRIEPQASAYVGPFVTDYSHPLTEGLALGGVVWAAGGPGPVTQPADAAKPSADATRPTADSSGGPGVPGVPIITAGNVPLLTVAARPVPAGGGGAGLGQDIWLRLRPDLSTLPQSPNWPILFWNLAAWRRGEMPGLRRANLPLGAQAVWVPGPAGPVPASAPANPRAATLTAPDGSTRTLRVNAGPVSIPADDVGVYRLETERGPLRFAVAALDGGESDLRGCAAGQWGSWINSESLRREYASIAWAPVLLALGLLLAHGFFTSQRAKPSHAITTLETDPVPNS